MKYVNFAFVAVVAFGLGFWFGMTSSEPPAAVKLLDGRAVPFTRSNQQRVLGEQARLGMMDMLVRIRAVNNLIMLNTAEATKDQPVEIQIMAARSSRELHEGLDQLEQNLKELALE